MVAHPLQRRCRRKSGLASAVILACNTLCGALGTSAIRLRGVMVERALPLVNVQSALKTRLYSDSLLVFDQAQAVPRASRERGAVHIRMQDTSRTTMAGNALSMPQRVCAQL